MANKQEYHIRVYYAFTMYSNQYVYVIVIVQLSGIYGSKRTESEGDSPRTRFVYVAIMSPMLYCTTIGGGIYV